jgi:hypothetical protein
MAPRLCFSCIRQRLVVRPNIQRRMDVMGHQVVVQFHQPETLVVLCITKLLVTVDWV